jgi:hypothetical protein
MRSRNKDHYDVFNENFQNNGRNDYYETIPLFVSDLKFYLKCIDKNIKDLASMANFNLKENAPYQLAEITSYILNIANNMILAKKEIDKVNNKFKKLKDDVLKNAYDPANSHINDISYAVLALYNVIKDTISDVTSLNKSFDVIYQFLVNYHSTDLAKVLDALNSQSAFDHADKYIKSDFGDVNIEVKNIYEKKWKSLPNLLSSLSEFDKKFGSLIRQLDTNEVDPNDELHPRNKLIRSVFEDHMPVLNKLNDNSYYSNDYDQTQSKCGYLLLDDDDNKSYYATPNIFINVFIGSFNIWGSVI